MRTYRINREDGRLFAFEIENVYIRPRRIASLLDAVDGVSNIRLRKPFSSSSDVHLEFKYQGKDFMVWEPYGDSSRYWIGPTEEAETTDISALVKAFEEYQPPVIVKAFGDLMTLNFRSLLRSLLN